MVVGEIAVKKLIVCLNKIDSIQDEEKRKTKVEQVEKKIRMALSKSKFANTIYDGGNERGEGTIRMLG